MTLKFRYVLGVSYSYDVFRGGMSITILYIYILYIYGWICVYIQYIIHPHLPYAEPFPSRRHADATSASETLYPPQF